MSAGWPVRHPPPAPGDDYHEDQEVIMGKEDLERFLQFFGSSKSWAAIVGLVVAIFGERANLDAETITKAVVVLVAYILGEALKDGLSRSG